MPAQHYHAREADRPAVQRPTISPIATSSLSPEANADPAAKCGSERDSNQYANPPNTIEANNEKSSPLVAREIGPWNSDTLPYSNAHPATQPDQQRDERAPANVAVGRCLSQMSRGRVDRRVPG